MNKFIFFVLMVAFSHIIAAQSVGAYVFARTPQIVNYQMSRSEVLYSQGVSAGLGITHQNKFLELGSVIFDGNSHGYYSFFGSVLKSTELGSVAGLNSNWFGEVTYLPTQKEGDQATWIYTGGLCLFPNVQLKQVNIGIPLCLGLAYQQKAFSLNSRFILNLSYRL